MRVTNISNRFTISVVGDMTTNRDTLFIQYIRFNYVMDLMT